MLQLQQNVSEWKQSYDVLMTELRKLSLEKIVEKEELVKEVKVLSTDAKVGHVTVMCPHATPLPVGFTAESPEAGI